MWTGCERKPVFFYITFIWRKKQSQFLKCVFNNVIVSILPNEDLNIIILTAITVHTIKMIRINNFIVTVTMWIYLTSSQSLDTNFSFSCSTNIMGDCFRLGVAFATLTVHYCMAWLTNLIAFITVGNSYINLLSYKCVCISVYQVLFHNICEVI
jgi:hypothetical protein